MSEVIKEFLVALNYKVEGERTLTDSVNRATKAATTMFAAINAAALAITYATARAAENLEKLYYMSQRTNASAQNIRAFSFAAGQLGSSAEAAASAVENLAQKIKETGGERGGIAGLLRSLGVATSSGGKQRDTAEMLVDVGKKLATMAPNVARAYASALGIDERTLNALMSGKLAGVMAENADKARRMGYDANEAAGKSVGLMNALRGVGNTLQMLFEKTASALFDQLGPDIKKFDDFLIKNSKGITDALIEVARWVLNVATEFVKWLTGSEMDKGMAGLAQGIKGVAADLHEWTDALTKFIGGLKEVADWFDAITNGNRNGSKWLHDKLFGDKDAKNGFGWGGQGGGDTRSAYERMAPKWAGGKDAPGAEGSLPTKGNAAKRGDMMKVAMDELRKHGVPEDKLRAAAAHLVGQAEMESGLNPTKSHDGGTGYGIYGARDPKPGVGRKTDMLTWMKKNGFAPDSAEGQMRFMATEAMSGKYPQTKRILMNADPARIGADSAKITHEFESPQFDNDRSGAVAGAFRNGPSGDSVSHRIASTIAKIGDAIVPAANAATKSGAAQSWANNAPAFTSQPIGGGYGAPRGAVTNNFSPNTNITIMGGGPDMAPILGRTIERTNNDLLRNGVGAFN